MHKQAKNIFLLAIIVSSTIASLFAFSNNASAAAPALYIAPQATEDAIASAERVSLALCLTVNGGNNFNGGNNPSDTTSAGNISTGKWFYDRAEPQTRPGYLVDPDNGQVECRNLFDGHDVAGALGFNSNVELACAIGVKRTNGSDCVNGSGDFTEKDVTKNTVYSGIDNTRLNATGGKGFNDAQYYVMAANTYIQACGGVPVVALSDANADQKNNDNYDQIKIVDFSGATTTVIYKKDNNGGKAFQNKDNSDYDYVNQDCNWMAQKMNGTAAAYAAFVKAHQPGQNGTPGTCQEAYNGKDSELAACQDGFAHKGEGEYCEAHYPIHPTYSKEATACLYGQDKATAADGTTAAPAQPGADKTSDNKSSCNIEGVGWIICPVVNFMAKVVDGAYAFVASLLVVQPLLTPANGADSGTIYGAWSVMRNFANVAFVIAFLLIIFSQLTSVGISNYGIKKMLPRLVVAAILVNVSYWICAIAVDLSNIIGGSVNDVLKGITDNSIPGPSGGAFSSGGGWTGIAGGILAGTIVVVVVFYATLSALIPALIAALLAIVTVFLVLTIRQALIILLIVISPLAFVAYLLPNTESMFKKWRQLFQTLLYMYPIIAAIFGTSALASKVVMNSATGPYSVAIQIMGALISIIPLALTPIVMKTAGSLLGKIGGNINNPNKGLSSKIRKTSADYADRRSNIAQARRLAGTSMFKDTADRWKSGNKFQRGAGTLLGGAAVVGTPAAKVASWRAGAAHDAEMKNANAANAVNEAKQNRVVSNVTGSNGAAYAQSIAGPTGNVGRVEAAAIAAQKKAFREAIENATISANLEPGEDGIAEAGRRMEQAVRDGNTVMAQAMQNKLLTSGGPGLSQYRRTMTSMGNSSDGTALMQNAASKEMRRNMLENHSKLKADAADFIVQAAKGGKMSDATNTSSTWSGLSDNDLVHQKKESVRAALDNHAITIEQAVRIKTDPELSKHLTPKERDDIFALAPNTPAGHPAPASPSTPGGPTPPGPTSPPPPPPGAPGP